MPLYDFACPKCDRELKDVYLSYKTYTDQIFDFCPEHGHIEFVQVIRPVYVEDWGNGGSGRREEHLGPQSPSFFDRKSYRKYLKDNNIRQTDDYYG